MTERASRHRTILAAGVPLAVASWWLPWRVGAVCAVVGGIALYLSSD